jgi:hypothetical protein
MTELTVFWMRRLTSLRSPGRRSSPVRMAVALLLRVGCAGLLAWIGYIHLHLWQEGYRQILPTGRSSYSTR